MNAKEQLALGTVKTLYGITIVSFVAIGIQLFICSYGLSLFLETPKNIRRGRIPYILISWIIFVLFCLSQTGDAYQVFTILYHGAADNPADILRLRHNDDHSWWRLSSTFCIHVVNWVADGLLVYRCYIIWTDNLYVCILPFLTYLASVTMSSVTFASIQKSTSISSRINTKALSSWIYLSVTVNFLVTGLITFRLLRLRAQMSQFMSRGQLKVYLGVVAILVESAVPLTITGLVFATVANPKNVQERIPNGMFLVLWFSLNAICPQLIIFRVTSGRSWLRHPEVRSSGSHEDAEAVMTNIAFTHGRETGASDIESCSDNGKVELPPPGEKDLVVEDRRLGSVIDVRRRDGDGLPSRGPGGE